MKLIHLSDLHLGRRLIEVSLLEDQKYILRQILNIIRDEQADAVLLSGDIYDKSVPSAEAVTLLDDFLNNLVKLQVKVYVISGNHDSAERLAFANKLIESTGIYLSPVYDGNITPLQLSDEHGSVNFWLLPFIKPVHVKRFYPEEAIESYTDACRVAVEKMGIDPKVRNVLLTHQFVTGSETCESEEISVGGTDNVDAAVFECFDYVALGHIHGPQNIMPNKIRYCGTPLKYSFSEANHHKSVTVVELGAKGDVSVHTVALNPRHDLRVIRGRFEEITNKAFYEGTDTEDYIQVVLTNEDDVSEAVGKLRTIYPNLIQLKYDNTRTRANQIVDGATDVEHKSPLQLFSELYEKQNNQPMTEEQLCYMQELIESIKEETK